MTFQRSVNIAYDGGSGYYASGKVCMWTSRCVYVGGPSGRHAILGSTNGTCMFYPRRHFKQYISSIKKPSRGVLS